MAVRDPKEATPGVTSKGIIRLEYIPVKSDSSQHIHMQDIRGRVHTDDCTITLTCVAAVPSTDATLLLRSSVSLMCLWA